MPGFGSLRVTVLTLAAVALAAVAPVGCSCRGGRVARPYAAPETAAVLAHLKGVRERVTSYKSESVMDYWTGKERVKGTVLLMGRWGRYARMNALNPTGGNVAADLACDGVAFTFVDVNNNCYLLGPCNKDAIAQLLGVSLEPDDFMLLALGSTPVLEDATAKVTWDAKRVAEIVELSTGDGGWTQTIVLDGHEQRWDVLESTVRRSDGSVEWKIQNKDFRKVKLDGEDRLLRVPGKTLFVQPKTADRPKADLLVRWESHTFNAPISDDKFTLDAPEGIRQCGQ